MSSQPSRFSHFPHPCASAAAPRPGPLQAALVLGAALALRKLPRRALRVYRQALARRPGPEDAVQLHQQSALALMEHARAGGHARRCVALAQRHLQRAEQLGGTSAQLLLLRAQLLAQYLSHHAAAQACLQRALALQPDYVPALVALSRLELAQARPESACRLLARAVRAEPSDAFLWQSLAHTMIYDPGASAADLGAVLRSHGAVLRAAVGQPAPRWPAPAVPADGRLTLGLVSGDLRSHPCGQLVEGVLARLPREHWRVLCLSNHHAVDAHTRRLQSLADGWHQIEALDTARVCALVRDEGVHVLIDLSGLTDHNRLDVFAARAAPLQLSWLGSHVGTGLDTMDGQLLDARMARGLQAHFSERLCDLPWSFNQPAESLPDAGPLLQQAPCERKGHVTFGSLSNPAKFNAPLLDAWAQVLLRVPGARLAQRFRSFADPEVGRVLRAEFARRGVAPERIDCLPGLPLQEALLWLAAEVDLGLDTFPHGAHTTALQSLAMGVPLVTMHGEQASARVCAVLQQRLGLQALVAEDVPGYVRRAQELAGDAQALAQLRRSCRARALASPLLDAQAFAQGFSQTLQRLWHDCLQGWRR